MINRKWKNHKIRHRAVGIIIKGGTILLMHRIKNGREFYVFPGGGVEPNESLEEGLKREIKEEAGLDVKKAKFLFEQENQLPGDPMTGYPNEHYFLIKNFSGKPELGGPEKERMDIQNQYSLEWVDLGKLEAKGNLYPQRALQELIVFLRTKK
jgi:8-oxo-dGTP pyrophosphatase MutT (NUDIX family)